MNDLPLPRAPLLALLVVALALAGVRAGWLPPLLAFGVAVLAWSAGATVALVTGIVGLRHGSEGAAARARARSALLLGAAMLAGLSSQLPALRAPRIHDVTTNPADPPRFRLPATLEANAGRELSYPQGGAEVPALQRAAYPELTTIRLPAEATRVLARLPALLEGAGLRVVGRDPAAGQVEATATSRWFRFVDDVVVRVRSGDQGCLVDARSLSRVGRSDLGANAARIRRIRDLLRAEFGDG